MVGQKSAPDDDLLQQDDGFCDRCVQGEDDGRQQSLNARRRQRRTNDVAAKQTRARSQAQVVVASQLSTTQNEHRSTCDSLYRRAGRSCAESNVLPFKPYHRIPPRQVAVDPAFNVPS